MSPTAPPVRGTAPAATLSLADVSVARGAARLLSQVSLSIAPGERVALIGPSGAGKTTLLSVLGAALRPTEGAVRVDGTDPWHLSSGALRALRARLFLAPQAPPLPPRQRVVTAVLAGRLPSMSLGAAVASLLRPSDPRAAHDALARFGLQDRLWARVDRLSGGERQRVSLARALVSQAGVFLADEPLSALDPALARQSLDALAQAAETRGATLVCSLHQTGLALARFPRVVGLRDGRVLFDRPPARLHADDIARLYAGRQADPAAPGAAPHDAASADARADALDRVVRQAATDTADAAAGAPLPPTRCF